MTTEMPDREPGAHLAIAGTGRAGTSFLVRYLTELGLDTHLARYGEKDSWDEYANAGLETVPLPDQRSDLPYVVKYPWLYQCIDYILASKTMRFDAVIVPVRDLGETAISRTLVELQAMHRSLPWMAELDKSWEVWGSTPGGLTYSLNPLDQGRLLAVGFHQLVERLIRADIRIVLLAFPRLVEDPHYLFRKLQPFLPATVSEDIAVEAHSRIADLTKVRVRDELSAAALLDASTHRKIAEPSDQVAQYALHDRLDAIAIRRELVRVRKLQIDAESAAQAARREVAATQAAADKAIKDAKDTAEKTIMEGQAAANRAVAEARAATEIATRDAQAAANTTIGEFRTAADKRTGQARATASKFIKEARVLKQALADAQCQLSAEQLRAATLQREINKIFGSRSWRLTSGYRILGRAVQRLRHWRYDLPGSHVDLPILDESEDTHVSHSSRRDESEDVCVRLWTNWPVWIDDNSFRTRRFQFVTFLDKGEVRTNDDTVILLKDRKFVDVLYRNLLLGLRPKRIFEIGFFQGGMPLFLADMVSPEKVVAIDHSAPSDELRSLIERAGLTASVKLHPNIPQNDTALITQLLNDEFGDQPLDLIVDDASHEYEDTKACFEAFFGYLRPGGKYIIEDWGWLHWPGDQWQTAKSRFWKKPVLTNLVFEVVMTLGSTHPDIIAKVEVLSWACIAITRGAGLRYRGHVNLQATRLTCGRAFHPL